MKTILFSQIRRRKVQTSADKGTPKVVDLIGTKSKNYIKIIEMKGDTGLINQKAEYFPIKAVKPLKKGDEDIYLKDSKSAHKQSRGEISLSSLKNAKVYDADDEEIGRVYDYEIYIEEMPWLVWKILVKSHLISVIERRLRIPLKYVSKLEGNKIYLDKEIDLE